MPAEIKLSDGSKLTTPESGPKVRAKLAGSTRGGLLVSIESQDGSLWVNPLQIVYVRDLGE